MKSALYTVCAFCIAFAILCATIANRDRLAMREADRLRITSDVVAKAAIDARDKALAVLSEMEMAARSCRAEVAAVEASTVEDERATCDALLEASVARGRLDVPSDDLQAVVDALRARRPRSRD